MGSSDEMLREWVITGGKRHLQVTIAVDAAAAAARPQTLTTAQPWSFWVLCFALLCQLLLSAVRSRRYAYPGHTGISSRHGV